MGLDSPGKARSAISTKAPISRDIGQQVCEAHHGLVSVECVSAV